MLVRDYKERMSMRNVVVYDMYVDATNKVCVTCVFIGYSNAVHPTLVLLSRARFKSYS